MYSPLNSYAYIHWILDFKYIYYYYYILKKNFVVDIDPDINMNTTSIKKQCANNNHLKFNKLYTEQQHIYFTH